MISPMEIIEMIMKYMYVISVILILLLIYYGFNKLPLDNDTSGRVTQAVINAHY